MGAVRGKGLNFTGLARQVLVAARDEATQYRQGRVTSEHILLALIKMESGICVSVMQNLGVDLDRLQQRLESGMIRDDAEPGGVEHRFSSPALKVLEHAFEECDLLEHGEIGTQHILLGLIAGSTGDAADALREVGLNGETARAEVERLAHISE